MSSTQETVPPSAFHWAPSPGWRRVFVGMQSVLGWIGGAVSAIACIVVAHAASPGPSFLGALLLAPLWFLTIGIHEWGHVLAARRAGLTVAWVRIGPLELQAQRAGWRMRWRWSGRVGLHGYVIAYPGPNARMRAASLRMVAGGPAANLCVALVAIVAAWALGHSTAGWAAVALAAANAAAGLCNLVPTSLPAPSDGLLLLQWHRNRDEQAPELILARLCGLSLHGVPAQELPPYDVSRIEHLPMPMPLVHLWFVLKAYQNTGDWARAAALESTFARRLESLPASLKSAFGPLVKSLECEIRFSRGMAGSPQHDPLDHGIDRDGEWHYPWLRPRCRALQAALDGDDAATRKHLEEARYWAAKSIDRGLEISEATLAEAVLSRLASRVDGMAVRAGGTPCHARPRSDLPGA